MAAALSRSTKPLVVYYCRTYVKCNKAVREGEDAEGEMEDVCCIPQPGLRDWSDHLRCPHLCATPICDVPVPQVALNLMEGMEDLQEDAPPASGDASSSTRKAQKAHADGGGKAQRGSAVARRLRMGPSGWDPTGLGLPDPPCCARNCPYLGCCV